MSTIRIVVSVPTGIDAGDLNEELKAALGVMPLASHNAVEAIVECDPADEATVRAVIDAHIAGTAKRERNKKRLAKIARLEEKQTPRRIREAALSQAGKDWLQTLENQIKAERDTLES